MLPECVEAFRVLAVDFGQDVARADVRVGKRSDYSLLRPHISDGGDDESVRIEGDSDGRAAYIHIFSVGGSHAASADSQPRNARKTGDCKQQIDKFPHAFIFRIRIARLHGKKCNKTPPHFTAGCVEPKCRSASLDPYARLSSSMMVRAISTPMTDAIMSPRVHPLLSPRQCNPSMEVFSLSSILILLL